MSPERPSERPEDREFWASIEETQPADAFEYAEKIAAAPNLVDNENWQDVLARCINLTERFNPEGQERKLKASFAKVLEHTYHLYRQNDRGAVDFAQDLNSLLRDNPLPEFLTEPESGNLLPGKRQPSLQESIEATLDRYHFIEQLPAAFGEKADGIIIGGSMSYGPFFNVRSGEDSSDIDAIVVMDESFLESDDWQGFNDAAILTEEEKQLFLERKEIFKAMHEKGEADILSQRFTARDGDFNMSTHFFPLSTFEAVHASGLARDLRANRDTVAELRDYKPALFERDKADHQGFDGSSVDYILPPQEEVENGFIATIPAYVVNNEQFYPGLYQCLSLPESLVAYDRSGETSRITNEFDELVANRLEEEKILNPASILLNAYPRRIILAPGRYNHNS